MSSLKVLTALALLSLPIVNYAAPCSETWNASTVNWGEAANWTGGACAYPGVVANNGDTATFAGHTPLTVRLTLADNTTAITPSITNLNLTTMNYIINPEMFVTPVASLGFDTSASDTITVGAGTTQTINAPMTLNGANPLTVTVGSGGALDIIGNVTDASTSSLIYSGPGTLNITDMSAALNNPGQTVTLAGSTTYMSNTGSLFINSGTLQITNNLDITNMSGSTLNLTNATEANTYILGGTLALENNNTVFRNNGLSVEYAGAYFNVNGGGGVFLPAGSGGAVTLTNNAEILFTPNGANIGCFLVLPDTNVLGELYVGAGTSVTSINTGQIDDRQTGTWIICNNLTLDGGTFTMTNSGTVVVNNAWGTAMNVNTVMTVTGGTFAMQSIGSNPIGDGCYGTYVQIITAFNQSGGLTQITSTNTGGGLGIPVEFESYRQTNITGGVFQNDVVVLCPTINVSGTGTLCGTGTFALNDFPLSGDTSVTNMGATLLAGDTIGGPPGVMTIMGDYTQNTGGTFGVNLLTLNGDVPGPTSFSQLGVSGTATIEGSVTVGLSPGQTVMNGDAYTILISETLVGTFELGVIPFNFPPGYSAALSYPQGQNSVVLTMTIIPPTPPSPPGPSRLGPFLTSYPAYYQSIFASVNHTHTRLEREMRGLRNRFNQEKEPAQPVSRQKSSAGVTPSLSEKLPIASIQTTSNQICKDHDSSFAFMNWEQVQKQHQLTQRVEGGESHPWNIYLGPIGTSGEIHTKHHAIGYNEWSAGALTGFDYAFSQVGVGLMADYERVQGYVNHHWGEFSINQAHVSFYMTYAPKALPKLGINAIVGGGYDWVDIHRHTEGKTAKGDSRVGEFDALFGLEYTFVKEKQCGYGQFQFTPMVNVQYIYLDIDRYREHSAGFNDFKIHGQAAKSLKTTLGTWLGYLWEWCDFAFKPEVYLAWQREYFDRNHTLYVNPLNLLEPTTSIGMQGEGRNTYQAGLDLMFTLFNKYGLEVSYDFEWNNLFRDHAFYLGFNVQF